MDEPPDLGGYTINEDDCTSFVSTSPRKTLKKGHLSTLLLLYLFALLLPSTFGHVLPSVSRGSDAIEAHSDHHFERSSPFDASILGNEATLIQRKDTYNSVQDTLQYVPTKEGIAHLLYKRQASSSTATAPASTTTTSTNSKLPKGREIAFAILVVILVLLSGVFAGLTLGYMSLDETQLQVLMSTGSDIQKARAAKIIPIRKDGHLLLTTLLIANMITNETLPIIFDPLLPSQVLSVVISTILIVIFAELIPQSTCSRYGLQIGAYMAFPTRIIIIILWPVAFPVSRILHWVLGAHHGIVYRRAELKELVTLHAASGGRGGDLKRDTVMIVGGALDLQEKVVKQAMTPIDQVFMLPFTAKLDYPTLEKVVRSGHSRIPIYQEIEVEVGPVKSGSTTPKKKLPLLATFTRKASTDDAHGKAGSPRLDAKEQNGQSQTEAEGLRKEIRKKIVGTLLVKSCVLLDPEDAVPVSSMVINALPTVPADEPLLNVLNAFQEGRSHMAIVSPRSRRGISDSVADLGSKSNLYRSSQGGPPAASAAPRVDGLGDIDEEKNMESANEISRSNSDPNSSSHASAQSSSKTRLEGSPKRRHLWSRAFRRGESSEGLEQDMPADAIIDEKNSNDLRRWDSQHSYHVVPVNESGLPLGIITLEDVLEELLGEEILDEYDDRGNEEQDFRNLMPPPSPEHGIAASSDVRVGEAGEEAVPQEVPGLALEVTNNSAQGLNQTPTTASMSPPPPTPSLPMLKKTMLTRLGITRQRSQRDSPSSTATIMTEEPGNIDEATLGDPVTMSPSPVVSASTNSYFDESTLLGQRQRASSVPPIDRQEAEETRGRSVSRPPSPITPAPSSTVPPLYSPQPNRAVVIRTQAPGGTPITTIATESLLRGRQQSLPNQSHVTLMTSSSRSQTPAGASNTTVANAAIGGNKGNRFKSQAAVGVGGSTTGAFPSAPIRGRSQGRPLTSDEPSQPSTPPDDNHDSEEGGDTEDRS